MKNLFKFTLCAFAAIALTNCTEDLSESGNGNNTPDAGFTMTIHAGVAGNDTDETRTAVKIDTLADNTTAYRVIWKGNDQLSIAEFADYEISEDGLTVAYQKEGSTDKLAIFQTKFKSIMGENKRYDYLSCYPHNNNNRFTINASEAKAYMTMPATQTYDPAGLVDGSAMLLTSAHLGNEGRPYQIDLRFKHAAAYVKMTFDGIELGKGEKITDIILTAGMEKEDGETTDEDAYLAGSCVYTYAADPEGDGSTATDPDGDQSKSVTLKVSNADFAAGDDSGKIRDNLYIVPTFTVYFATLPVELNAFTVTIVTDNHRRYVRKVDVIGSGKSQPIPFVAGEVRAVKISGKDFETEKLTVYRKAKSVADLKDKECVIVSTDEKLGDLYTMLNSGTNNSAVAGKKVDDVDVGFAKAKFEFDGTSEDVLLHADASDYTWTISGTGPYTFVSTKDGTGLRSAGDNQTLRFTTNSDDNGQWTIEYNDVDGFKISDGQNTGYMQTYSSQRNNWYTLSQKWAKMVDIYYKTDQSKDVNDKEEEVNKEVRAATKYYRRVSTFENGKNYVIAANCIRKENGETYNDGTLYTFNNYKTGICTPVALLAPTAEDVEFYDVKNAGFIPVTDKIYSDMELYESKFGVYYTWTRTQVLSNTYFITTDAERLGESNKSGLGYSLDGLFFSAAYQNFNVTPYGEGFSLNSSNYNTYYLNLSSTTKWTFGYNNPQEIYFYEEMDKLPDEKPTEYKRITTNALPVGTEATKDSTPVIITATDNSGNTFVLHNVPDATGTSYVTTMTLADAKFNTTETGINGPISKFTWDATLDGDAYKFNSTSRKGDYAMLTYSNSKLAYTNTNAGTSFTLKKVADSDDIYYRLCSGSDYLSVDASGNLSAGGESSAAKIRLYGLPDAVTEQEEFENREPDTEYKKFTTWNLPANVPVIITITKGSNTYVLYNVPDGVVSNGEPYVTSKALGDVFTTTATGISGPVSKYTWDVMPNGSAYRFNSTSRTGEYAALMYSGSRLAYTNGQYGTSFTLYKTNINGDYYIYNYVTSSKVTKYLSVDNSGNPVSVENSSDVTVNFYGPIEDVEAQEAKETAEYYGEYKKITTNALPVGTEATKDSTPVVMTVTDNNGNTYVLHNVSNGVVDNDNTPDIKTMPLRDVFTTTETGISGPVSKFAWDATLNGSAYRFNSQSRTGNYAALLFNTGSKVSYTNSQYSTSLTLQKVDDEGNYYLYSGSNYLSVNESGNLVTTNESNAAKVNFYGLPEAVEQQDKKENSGPTFEVVSDMQQNDVVIITNGSYAVSNTGNNGISISGGITVDKYQNMTFKVTKSGSFYYFQSTTNQKWLTKGSNGYVDFADYSTSAYWKLTDNKLSYLNSSDQLSTKYGGLYWTLISSDPVATLTIYKVVQ